MKFVAGIQTLSPLHVACNLVAGMASTINFEGNALT